MSGLARRIKRGTAPVLLSGLVILVSPDVALAFKLQPEVTDNEGHIRRLEESRFGRFIDATAEFVIKHFTSPVHEEITHQIYGCELPNHACGESGSAKRYASLRASAGMIIRLFRSMRIRRRSSLPVSTTSQRSSCLIFRSAGSRYLGTPRNMRRSDTTEPDRQGLSTLSYIGFISATCSTCTPWPHGTGSSLETQDCV